MSKDFENLQYGYSIAWWNSAKYSFKLIIQALIYILIINYASVIKHCQNQAQSNTLVKLSLHHQTAFSVCDTFYANRKQALIKHCYDYAHFVMIKKLGSVIWCLTLLYIIKERWYTQFPHGCTFYPNLSFFGFLVVVQQYGSKIGMRHSSGF